MKKIVSIILAIAMMISLVAVVSAATVNDLTSYVPNPLEVGMEVGVLARKSGTGNEYVAPRLVLQEPGLSNGVGIDYKSTLNMEPVRLIFDKGVITSVLASDGDAQAEFEAATVATQISVKITYPAGASFASDLTSAGVLDAGSIFSEVSRTPDGNTLTIVYKNRDNLTVAELCDNKQEYLKDIAFILEDDLSYNAEGQYEVKVEMEGQSIISFASKTQTINYSGANSHIVSASFPAQGGGSGVAGLDTAKKNEIKFEENGGSPVEDIIVSQGETITLPISEREGYTFVGWYVDEELTVLFDPEVEIVGTVVVYAKWTKVGTGHETPGALNGDDHFAYVVGYPDGTVRPNDNINRAEATAIFFRLLKEEVRNENLTVENDFDDVTAEDWFNTAVSTMANLGIIEGREAGAFVPEDYITRAEFATICARFDDSEFEIADEFTDIAGHWAENEIHKAAAYGWIMGYDDNTFRPDQLITRAEAMTMINRVLNRVPETKDDLYEGMVVWPDNADVDEWYYLPVQEATNSHAYEMKNKVYESWTAIESNTDWTIYQ